MEVDLGGPVVELPALGRGRDVQLYLPCVDLPMKMTAPGPIFLSSVKNKDMSC